MGNIIIFGSNGNIGKEIVNHLKIQNNIFLDTKFSINRLLSKDFINNNRINCIINCIGSSKDKDLYFSSNFIMPFIISDKISKLDLYIKHKIKFIYISTIGVNAPYMKYNFKNISYTNLKKSKINYNNYELSKSCGEFVVLKNTNNLKNISTLILQPSNIILKNSIFLKNLCIFLYLFPFKINHSIEIPITPINYLLKYIDQIIYSEFKNKLIIKKLYKREKIHKLFKGRSFFSILKFEIPLNIMQKIIKCMPENHLTSSLKRRLILIFIL